MFGLNRFRETELIHGRWAMLATLGVIVAEATTGVAWQDAGKVELDGASYLGLGLPFTVTCAPKLDRVSLEPQSIVFRSPCHRLSSHCQRLWLGFRVLRGPGSSTAWLEAAPACMTAAARRCVTCQIRHVTPGDAI